MNYAKAFGLTLAIFCVGAYAAYFLQGCFDESQVRIFRLISGSTGTVALFGKLGWSGQTRSGNSSLEKLDGALYKVIYTLGYFLFAVSILV
jgi:hypothetical protein